MTTNPAVSPSPSGAAPPALFSHPTWASARKDMVGTSLGSSRLWFTIAEGIVTEVYYPRIDIPQIKDLGFIIADDRGFWVEVRRLGDYRVTLASEGVPAVEIEHRHPRFVFTLRICQSERRDVLLIRCRLEGDASLRPYALLAARLGGDAASNLAWVGNFGGRAMLWAEQGPFGLALAAVDADGADAWRRCSVGCSEASDGWSDFDRNGRMTWQYAAAGPGAVALMGELPAEATLALGLGASKEAAATLAVSNLMEDFSVVWDAQCAAWKSWLSRSKRPVLRDDIDRALALSATVLKVHQDRTYCGAAVASLSVPWGDSSQSRGGYHLVWPRDLVETAGALIALEIYRDARDILRYLIATQQPDGHWFQKSMAGRRRVLAGHSARRSGVSHTAGGGVARTQCAARHSRGGRRQAGRGLHCPRRSRDQAGPLGRERRGQHLHARRRHRRARRGRRLPRRRSQEFRAAAGGLLERAAG